MKTPTEQEGDFLYILTKELVGKASAAQVEVLHERPLLWQEMLREKRTRVDQRLSALKAQPFQQDRANKIRTLGQLIRRIDDRLQMIRARFAQEKEESA